MKKIPLSKGKAFALVDDEDYEYLSQFTWKLQDASKNGNKRFYASRCVFIGKKKYKYIQMHRDIFGLNDDKSFVVDHIDHDGLNNQRSNLRKCTSSQNNGHRRKMLQKTTSKYKGVFYNKAINRYCSTVRLTPNSNPKMIGFKTEAEAAMAYNYFALSIYNEFAILNDIGY